MSYKKKLDQVFAFSGWTADRLADLLQVSNQTVSAWANGHSEPKGEHAARLDEIYGELVAPYLCELEKKADELAARLLRRQIRGLGDDNVCDL